MEVEAKFSIPDEQTFQRLLDTSSLAGFRLLEGPRSEIQDRYFDTDDGALYAGGYACRLRQHDGRHLATLKGLGTARGALHRREEHEVELPAPLLPQKWPPSTARDIALRLCGPRPLKPLFDINQVRHHRHLQDGERTVAEVALDRVDLLQDGAEADSYMELEAELLEDGTEQDLKLLAVDLHERWGLASETRSKFERGLELLGSAPGAPTEPVSIETHMTVQEPEPTSTSPEAELSPSPGIEPDDPMSEAGRKTFRFHYRRMILNEPGTRLGQDIEALHDMRVATRRMRAAFWVFGDHYKPKAVAPYLKGLRRTGRALGPVRDLDVFRAKVLAYRSSLPESQQGSLDSFLSVLEAQRKAARQRMIDYLDGDKYARFRERFGEFVDTEGMGSRRFTLEDRDPTPYRVRHVAPVAIYERLAAVRAFDEWVAIPDPPLERLHALRIACKRLRYSLEYFREVLGPNNQTVIKEIVGLQDHLGDLQDTVVASGILREFLARGTWGKGLDDKTLAEAPPAAPVDVEGVRAYLAAKQQEMRHLLDTFPQAWQQIVGSEFSQMVAEAVAVL